MMPHSNGSQADYDWKLFSAPVYSRRCVTASSTMADNVQIPENDGLHIFQSIKNRQVLSSFTFKLILGLSLVNLILWITSITLQVHFPCFVFEILLDWLSEFTRSICSPPWIGLICTFWSVLPPVGQLYCWSHRSFQVTASSLTVQKSITCKMAKFFMNYGKITRFNSAALKVMGSLRVLRLACLFCYSYFTSLRWVWIRSIGLKETLTGQWLARLPSSQVFS